MGGRSVSGHSADDVADRVRLYYRLVDADDLAGLIDLFAPDAVYCRPGYPPLIGRAELARFYGVDRVIESGRHTVVGMVATPAEVAVRGEFRGQLKDGRTVELRFADFFTFTEDLLFERRDTYFFAPMV